MNAIESPGLLRGFSFDRGDPDCGLLLEPQGLLHGSAAASAVEGGIAHPLCGGPAAFNACAVHSTGEVRRSPITTVVSALVAWAAGEDPRIAHRVDDCLRSIAAPRPPFGGVAMGRPCIVGIVNATPDSFSDGGDFLDPAAAVALGRGLIEAGAGMLDIGGESSRPGAGRVDEEIELARVLPVIEGLAGAGAPLSIDTRRAGVMRAALAAGADIVNDVSALTDDPAAIDVVKEHGAAVILMHGAQSGEAEGAGGGEVPHRVYAFLKERVAACREIGIPMSRIAVDPGLGFGKTPAENVEMFDRTGLLHGLGVPVMIGASRKFGIGRPPKQRIGASIAAAMWAAQHGVQLIRVHDVAETHQALQLLSQATNRP